MTADVIVFPGLDWFKPQTSEKMNQPPVPHIQHESSGKIIGILAWNKKGFQIYEDRRTLRDVGVEDFFAAMLSDGQVSIITKKDGCVNRHSLLHIAIDENYSHEITVGDFIRLTESFPGQVQPDDEDDYVTQVLTGLFIKIGRLEEEEEEPVCLEFRESDMYVFRPEKIPLAWGNWNKAKDCDYYACSVEDKDGSCLFYSAEDFSKPDTQSLLSLLVYIYLQYLNNKDWLVLDEQSTCLVLSLHKKDSTIPTRIPMGVIEEIIHQSLLRRNSLYAQISESDRMKRFYEKEIAPALLESSYGDDDDEE